MTVPNEITELIQSSGNSFHAKVARWLTKNGWHVIVSPYYMDQTQSKAREIDLVAEKIWPVTHTFDLTVDEIAIRLFIECKFIAAHAVFWMADKDIDSALALVCSNTAFSANSPYAKKHHNLAQSQRVAKLFSSKNNKNPEQKTGSAENGVSSEWHLLKS